MITNTIKYAFTSVPIIDIHQYLSNHKIQPCQHIANAFKQYGCVVIKDPRVQQKHNSTFIDMMEQYFQSRSQIYRQTKQYIDVFPHLDYQTGATPENIQKARDHSTFSKSLKQPHKSFSPQPPVYVTYYYKDAKWRYFWRIGQRDIGIKAPPRHAPYDFPQFQKNMDNWGNLMVNGCFTVAQMIAIGLGLQKSTFTQKMNKGNHLLAPTGSDLNKQVGSIFAGLHYDLNFLTIHGKSRYPGLFAWLNTGQRFTVKVPQGHLLLQAGKQLQILTGGEIQSGFHQVIYTDKVKQMKEQALKNKRSIWRISSTLFSHINQKVILQPLDKFRTQQSIKKYPKKTAYQHVMQQLKAINLSSQQK